MRKSKQNGFTLAELGAVLATLSILTLLSPAVSGTNRTVAKSIFCLNHYQQLTRAWMLYAGDHQGELPANYHGGEAQTPSPLSNRRKPWAHGWLDWGTRLDNTNLQYLVVRQYSVLADYAGSKPERFQCTEDKFLAPVQKARGWTNRVRSIAMNGTIGPGNVQTGPWDPAVFNQVTNLSGFRFPSPAETFVFIEEHPDSINDPLFFLPRSGPTLVDFPAALHSGRAALSFADGHAEMKRWTGPAAKTPVRFVFTLTSGVADRKDAAWLGYHSQRRSERTY